jgi:hypothetical protein
MSDLVRMAEAEFAEESPACGLVCREHAREAKLIQSSLLPAKELHHSAAEIAFRFLPFSNVGGDFADFFHLPNGCIGIYLGDVVGKGLPAAMYSALVMGTLRGIHKTGTDTAQVLTLLNERLVQRPIPGRFCCATRFSIQAPESSSSPARGCRGPCSRAAPGAGHSVRVGCPRECSRAAPTNGTQCSSHRETVFCSQPTVCMNCETLQESSWVRRR